MQTASKPRKSSSENSQRTSPATRSNRSSEVPRRTSPGTSKSSMTKIGGAESESTTPKSTSSRTPVDRSPRNTERRSPRSPVTEKKRPSRMSELECQLTQVQDDLKKAKDQLAISESWRRRGQQEAEESKKQLTATNAKLEDLQRQLIEFSAAEEARLQELRKVSEERDREWQSELETIQKQHSTDSAALETALNEIHRLTQQLEMVNISENAKADDSAMHSKLHTLNQNMVEALTNIEELKEELKISQKAETEAMVMAHDTQQQLEMAKTSATGLHLEELNLTESTSLKVSELEDARGRVTILEETVKKLEAALDAIHRDDIPATNLDLLGNLVSEVEQLKSALELAEIKYQEGQISSIIRINAAYELAEHLKINFATKEAELESSLKNAKAEILDSKASLLDKEAELQYISDMNIVLTAQVEQADLNLTTSESEVNSTAMVAELKASLLDKETELQNIIEENELLKVDIVKRETESRKTYEASITDVKLAKEAKEDALMKLKCATDEANKSSTNAARVVEQLEAAQAMNAEMEAEIRRMRVQSDQWRKAAEAAAAAISPGNNGRFVERTASLGEYQSVAGKLLSSPFSDDLEEDWPKKKNNKVMRKISGLWKKSPK